MSNQLRDLLESKGFSQSTDNKIDSKVTKNTRFYKLRRDRSAFTSRFGKSRNGSNYVYAKWIYDYIINPIKDLETLPTDECCGICGDSILNSKDVEFKYTPISRKYFNSLISNMRVFPDKEYTVPVSIYYNSVDIPIRICSKCYEFMLYKSIQLK